MARTFQELIQNRKELIESHRKNNFTDGIHALLTDLYPDTAHFIYELLQNAEDMNATEVRFVLKNDALYFEHNGTKRSFTLDDIDAITNIGHNALKKSDVTAIGKFGVGFKAVFAYTSTPEIHSGDYHFQIHDYFVPVVENVPKVQTRDSQGVEWTKFKFPFNHKTKSIKDAVREIGEGLRNLDEKTLLFLRNIAAIKYTLMDGSQTVLNRIASSGNMTTLSEGVIGMENNHSSEWLCFHRDVSIIDDKGSKKDLDIAVAFALAVNDKSGKKTIVPVDNAKTYIYFPAEKELSHLKFHINAAFASTVARDSIRVCEQNHILFDEIAKLTVFALGKIKEYGYLTVDFLSLLPNSDDELSAYYSLIRKAILDAFRDKAFLPDRNGSYCTSGASITGPVDISNLFDEDIIRQIIGKRYTWIQRPNKNRGLAFINDLDIKEFGHDDFKELFESDWDDNNGVFHPIERIVRNKSNKWLARFYLLCKKVFFDDEDSDNYTYRYYDNGSNYKEVSKTAILKATDGDFYSAKNIYYPPEGYNQTTGIPFFDVAIVNDVGLTKKESKRLDDFLLFDLDMDVFGEKAIIEKQLDYYKNNPIQLDDSYFSNILSFARFSRESKGEINFADKEIFVYEGKDKYHRSIAQYLVLGSAYGNDKGEIVANVSNKHCLWDEYAKRYNEGELKEFLDFIHCCGLVSELQIVRQSATQHPNFYEELDSGGRQTYYKTDEDYTIEGLSDMIDNISIETSRMIWKALTDNGDKKYEKARYAANNSQTIRVTDSSLIHYLKNGKWLPNRAGVFMKPSEISIEDLPDDFSYDNSNRLLSSLKIGTAKTTKEKERQLFEEELKKEGKRIVSEERFREFEEFERKQEERRERQKVKSLAEGLNRETRETFNRDELEDEEDSDSGSGYVRNPEKRSKNIEKTFRDEMKKDSIRSFKFSSISKSNKEEREKLREWYNGKCQICGTKITRYDGEPHFIARNIISSSCLPDSVNNSDYLCWNSLSLCPNCAAKYEVCSKDMSSFEEQILGKRVNKNDPTPIKIGFKLEGEYTEISFDPRHFFDMQTVFCAFETGIEQEEGKEETEDNTESINPQHDQANDLDSSSDKSIETKQTNPKYLMFTWLYNNTRQCPHDGGQLAFQPVPVVRKKDGETKKIQMLVCKRCKRRFIMKESLSDSIHLEDYYVGGTNKPS